MRSVSRYMAVLYNAACLLFGLKSNLEWYELVKFIPVSEPTESFGFSIPSTPRFSDEFLVKSTLNNPSL